jgi:hypothetical protein
MPELSPSEVNFAWAESIRLSKDAELGVDTAFRAVKQMMLDGWFKAPEIEKPDSGTALQGTQRAVRKLLGDIWNGEASVDTSGANGMDLAKGAAMAIRDDLAEYIGDGPQFRESIMQVVACLLENPFEQT